VIETLVLFGATGDLAGRYLLPALAALAAAGRLPDGFRVVGAAQRDLNDQAFRDLAAERLAQHAAGRPAAAREAVVRSLRYRRVDLGDAGSVARAVCDDGADPPSTTEGAPLAVYLALPPGLFPAAVTALGELGLPQGSRIVLEKPFGEDLESAMALNRLLADVAGVAGEQAVFRVDHFLGLATVQNVLGMRLANRVLEPVWNSAQIEQVDIVWEETLALEGRAAYYDRAGQLRDMIQNHLLQILCLIAMEPPASLGERDLRDRKLDVLRAVRPLRLEDTRRARYGAGRIGDRTVPAYVEEDGVDPRRGTETFAEVVLELDGWRWAGTRFRLRTGKALGRARQEVVVRFRPVPRLPFGDAVHPAVNELRIGLDVNEPGDLVLRLNGRAAGSPLELVPLTLTAELPTPELTEYSRVLLDVLDGDSTLSIRGDEAEEAWRIVEPVLDAWAAGEVPLEEYAAGSDGPR
jgi:glucose-6-phosphate 1-dehydrogenase